jgi:hypothetical protein
MDSDTSIVEINNIYHSGAKVVLPRGIAEGKGIAFSEGEVSSYNPLAKDILDVTWNDGHRGKIKLKHVITKEKYDQLLKAGMKIEAIIEYLGLFDGHIYN